MGKLAERKGFEPSIRFGGQGSVHSPSSFINPNQLHLTARPSPSPPNNHRTCIETNLVRSPPFENALHIGVSIQRRSPVILTLTRRRVVRQGFEEAYNRILLCVGQVQAPDEACVHIARRLRSGPTSRSLADIVRRAARQRVAGVVEMHDFLQALEIAVVTVSLHEGGIGPLVHVAQGGYLKAGVVVRRVYLPARIPCRGLAERMSA